MQVPQHPAHCQKQHHAHDHGNEHLIERGRVVGGRYRRAYADKQKNQRLQLISGSLGCPIYAVQDPGQQRQSTKGNPYGQPILRLIREKYLQKQEGLAYVQQHQSPRWEVCGAAAPPPAAGATLASSDSVEGKKYISHAAHGDAIPRLQ